jgi:HECT-domain (ubiquitin-transferase)
VQVTDSNKEEYVGLLAQYKMTESIHGYIDAFCEGLWGCISKDSLRVFSPDQLGLLISGRPDISLKDMQVGLAASTSKLLHQCRPPVVMELGQVS